MGNKYQMSDLNQLLKIKSRLDFQELTFEAKG